MSLPVLNRRLVLEAPERVPDGAGGAIGSWVSLGELWAEVRVRGGRELARAGEPVSRVSYRIVVRGAPVGALQRPLPDQRFRAGTRLYLIRAVTEADAAGRYLVCFADEEVAS